MVIPSDIIERTQAHSRQMKVFICLKDKATLEKGDNLYENACLEF